jgi:type IV pilus assembly protein PilO
VDAKAGITGSGNLELSGTVKTYRYMDEEETAAQEKAAAGTQPAGAQP